MSAITETDKDHLTNSSPDKQPLFATDIKLDQYANEGEAHAYVADPSRLPSSEKARMLSAGIVLDDLTQRTGTFIQKDQTPIHFAADQEGVAVMSISKAIDTHPWVADYFWKAAKAGFDKYTAYLQLNKTDGYFIRTLPGTKALFPVQACFFLGQNNLAQRVHNIVIAEAASELHIITGCTTHPMSAGLHLAVSEIYVKEGARLTFTMIHNWAPDVLVRPRSTVIVERDGAFLSNYISINPVRSIQMYPTAVCAGMNATARFSSIIVAPPGSDIDTGSRVILNGEGCRAEVISRAVTTGGNVVARGDIEANTSDVKGHLECHGLILSRGGTIHAIPELIGRVAGVDLSHEASVGKIREEELQYIMARGITRDEATAMVVSGFLNVGIEGLPPELDFEVRKAIEACSSGLL